MALPPKRIQLKRRFDEEPVESLYVQREQNQKRRRFPDEPETGCIFRLETDKVEASQVNYPTTLPCSSSNATSAYSLRVPTVQSTLPGEEIIGQKRSGTKDLRDTVSYLSSPEPSDRHLPNRASTTSNEHSLLSSKSRAEPRRFHLARTPSTSSLRHSSQSNGIHRQRRHHRKDLAVFVEKVENLVRSTAVQDSSLPLDEKNTRKFRRSQDSHLETNNLKSRLRKRPNATAIEKAWRVNNWVKPTSSELVEDNEERKGQRNVSNFSSNWDERSIKLAEEMYYVGLVEATDRPQKHTSSTLSLSGKIKPKPPPPRYHERQALVEAQNGDSTDPNACDENEVYVYDTYVRHIDSNQSALLSTLDGKGDAMRVAESDNVGVLVITEDDEEIWEAYGEDESSDEGTDSAEEDENAEDFHGNDYPEDEVDSEDEYGRGAYKYRHNASDDEEYDETTGACSGDEGSSERSWKHIT